MAQGQRGSESFSWWPFPCWRSRCTSPFQAYRNEAALLSLVGVARSKSRPLVYESARSSPPNPSLQRTRLRSPLNSISLGVPRSRPAMPFRRLRATYVITAGLHTALILSCFGAALVQPERSGLLPVVVY